MRFAIVTSMRKGSEVAATSLLAADALARHEEVEVWHPVCDRPTWTSHPTTFFANGEDAAAHLDGYDMVIYCLSDDADSVEVLRAARRCPGLVVLHDLQLTELACHSDVTHGTDLLGAAARHAGPAAVAALHAYRTGRDPGMRALRSVLPMTSAVLQHSLGVVTHRPDWRNVLRDQTMNGVTLIALPVLAENHAEAASWVEDSGVLTMVVPWSASNQSHVLDLLSDVAASESLRSTTRIRLARLDASIENQDEVARITAHLQLQGVESFRPGLAPKLVLAGAAMVVAVGATRLPGPTRLLVEAMARGLLILLPQEWHGATCAGAGSISVGAGGAASWVEALEGVVRDPSGTQAIAGDGPRHVRESHSPSAYATSLLVAAEAAMRARFLVDGVRQMSDRMTALGIAGSERARNVAAAALADLFDTDDSTRWP